MDVRLRELERAVREFPGSVEAQGRLLLERLKIRRVRLGWFLVPETGHASNFGFGLRDLRNSVSAVDLFVGLHPSVNNVARPLTFKETIRARVDQFNFSGRQRTAGDLFSSWLDTCSPIVYKKNNTKFKIIFQSDALLGVGTNISSVFLSVDYDKIVGKGVVELDFLEEGVKYNELLTQNEVLKHPGWLAVVEGDKDLLKEYCDIVFGLSRGKNMGFWTLFGNNKKKPNTIYENQLRALAVNLLDDYSSCLGGRVLGNDARFARVSVINREPEGRA